MYINFPSMYTTHISHNINRGKKKSIDCWEVILSCD